MSQRAMAWAIDVSVGSASERITLMVLAYHANTDNKVWLSLDRLKLETALERAAIARLRNRFESANSFAHSITNRLLVRLSEGASSREPVLVANIVFPGVGELRPPIRVVAALRPPFASRTARDENVAVNLHHLFRRYSTANMQVVDVLRNKQELSRVLGQPGDCFVRGVRPRTAYALLSLAIPFPN